MKCDHPGVILNNLMTEVGMSRGELSVRAGVSEKHICTVINGDKGISKDFAKKLGFIFKYTATDWLKFQAEYDGYQAELQENNNISDEEINILKSMKEIVSFMVECDFMHNNCGDIDKVIQLRNVLGVSDLAAIPQITYNAAYRAQLSANAMVNPYILFAWQRLCELQIEKDNLETSNNLDINLLKSRIGEIKNVMFEEINKAVEKLQKIFAECGISFDVVKNFRGAPVQGFIKCNDNDKMILCLTIRGQRADTFWFTLFHEIGHIINGDYSARFVDFSQVQSDTEKAADEFAWNTLIESKAYSEFVMTHNDFSYNDILTFSKLQKVKPYIVIGRLQKDGYLDWSEFTGYIEKYQWA